MVRVMYLSGVQSNSAFSPLMRPASSSSSRRRLRYRPIASRDTGAILQERHVIAMARKPPKQLCVAAKAFRQSLGVVQSINAQNQGSLAGLARSLSTSGPSRQAYGGVRGRSLRRRSQQETHRPARDVAGPQRLSQVISIGLRLCPDKLIGAEEAEQALSLRQGGEQRWWRERTCEKADPELLHSATQGRAQRNEVIVMHPDQITVVQQRRQGGSKHLVHSQIGVEGLSTEFGKGGTAMRSYALLLVSFAYCCAAFTEFRRQALDAYLAVNEMFAAALAPLLDNSDLVWSSLWLDSSGRSLA